MLEISNTYSDTYAVFGSCHLKRKWEHGKKNITLSFRSLRWREYEKNGQKIILVLLKSLSQNRKDMERR